MKSCSLAARNILFISTTFCGKCCNRVCIARSREKGGMSIQVESELSPKGQKGVTLGEEWKKLFLEKVLGKEKKNIFQKLSPCAPGQRPGANRASLHIQGTASPGRRGKTTEAGLGRGQMIKGLVCYLQLDPVGPWGI